MAELELWVSLVGVVGVFLGLFSKTFLDLRAERNARETATETARNAQAGLKVEREKREELEKSAAALERSVAAAERSASASVEQVAEIRRLVEAATTYLEGSKQREVETLNRIVRLEEKGLAPNERLIALEEQKVALQKQAQDWEAVTGLLGLLFPPKKSRKR